MVINPAATAIGDDAVAAVQCHCTAACNATKNGGTLPEDVPFPHSV